MLTIIIPFYNSKTYILRTLVSLKKQTYSNFQVIFIDDGSTDQTDMYIRDNLSDSKIQYQIIKNTHRGVSHARNTGLKYISTPYTMFLDSDDYVDDTMLQVMLGEMVQHDLDIIYCGYDHVKNGKTVQVYSDNYRVIKSNITGKQLLDKIFNGEVHIITSSVIYRSKLLEDLYFDEDSLYHEDLEFYYKVISRADSIQFYNEVLAHYVMRESSISHDLNLLKLKNGIHSLRALQKFLNDEQCVEVKTISKINTQLIPETLFVFFNYLFKMDNVVEYYMSSNYFSMMKKYKVFHSSRRNLNFYIRIKLIANFPRLYILGKKNYLKYIKPIK